MVRENYPFAKSPRGKQQLSRCGNSLELDDKVLEGLFQLTREVIYDKMTSNMAGARASKWKKMKRKSFTRLPLDADSLRQHCYCVKYLYILCHPFLKHNPSPVGHGWQLVGGRCRPVRHTQPALPTQLPLPGPAEENEDDGETDKEGDDIVVQVSMFSDDSESSELSDSD